MKKTGAFIVTITAIVMLSLPLLAAGSSRPGTANVFGDYTVYVYKNAQWIEAGRLGFNQYYTEQKLDLSSLIVKDRPVKLRLKEQGGGAAHIDSVLLGGKPPEKVTGAAADGLKKLAKKDNDVLDAFQKTIDLQFPASNENKVLTLNARVEGTTISKTPFQFPLKNLCRPVTPESSFYTYTLSTSSKVKPAQLTAQKPFIKEFCPTGSGHPSGDTYVWVGNDENYLYAAMDFTPDNTMDGNKDYAKLYVKNQTGLKEFKIAEDKKTWGAPEFTYTDKVPYQHKYYTWKIPLKEIGVTETGKAKGLQLAFTAYGTAAYGGCPVALTSPSAAVASFGGEGSFGVISAPKCTWKVSGSSPWITGSFESIRTGNGTVFYRADANLGPARIGAITVTGSPEMVFMVKQEAGSAADLNNGLIGYWSFNNCTADDSSVNNQNGNLIGGPVCGEGQKYNALYFDGINDYVSIGNSNIQQITASAMTVAAWIKLKTDVGNDQWRIISKEENTVTAWGLEIYAAGYVRKHVTATGNNLTFHDSGVTSRPSSIIPGKGLSTLATSRDYVDCVATHVNLNPGEWYHVAATDEGNTIKMYVNGALINTCTSTYVNY